MAGYLFPVNSSVIMEIATNRKGVLVWQRRGSDFKRAYDKDDVWLQVVFKVSE